MQRADLSSQSLDSGHGPSAFLRRIVVALDGTPFAEVALPTASALGLAYHAEVVLVRARTARPEPTHSRLGLRRHERESLTRASLYLARIEQELRAKGVRALSISPVGDAANAIAAVAAEDCDLVVIATHGGGGLARSAQISVACELATRCAVPMLMLPQAARGLLTPATSTPTFIMALSGERRDSVLLRLVASLARSIGGRVMAVCSTSDLAWQREPGAREVNVPREQVEARVTSYLESVRNDLATREVAAWTAIVNGELASEIARLPREEGDLIVLGSHGSLLRRQAAAKAAMALLRTTGSAVMLVPEDPLLTVMEGGQFARTPGGDAR